MRPPSAPNSLRRPAPRLEPFALMTSRVRFIAKIRSSKSLMYRRIPPCCNVRHPPRTRNTLTAPRPLVLYGGGDPPLGLSSEAVMKGKAVQTSRLPVHEVDPERMTTEAEPTA